MLPRSWEGVGLKGGAECLRPALPHLTIESDSKGLKHLEYAGTRAMDRTGGDHFGSISVHMQGAHNGLVVLEENCCNLCLTVPASPRNPELTLK